MLRRRSTEVAPQSHTKPLLLSDVKNWQVCSGSLQTAPSPAQGSRQLKTQTRPGSQGLVNLGPFRPEESQTAPKGRVGWHPARKPVPQPSPGGQSPSSSQS